MSERWFDAYKVMVNLHKLRGILLLGILLFISLLFVVTAAEEPSLTFYIINQQAETIAQQIDSYILFHQNKTIDELKEDPYFQSIIFTKVGESGYGFLAAVDSRQLVMHPSIHLLGTDLSYLQKDQPEFWAFYNHILDGSEECSIYPSFIDQNQTREKFTCGVQLHEKIAGKSYVFALTGYIDELEELSLNQKTSTFSKEAIKQKSHDVAKQIEIYLEAYPEKTIADLQQDDRFKEIAVQRVGSTGYTAATDYTTLINRFHANPAIVDLDLSTLAQSLPGFWRIMEKTKGGFPSEGTYDWREADGSIREKYMYISIVNVKTADGVGLSVAATTYLDEFANTSAISKQLQNQQLESFEELFIKLKALQTAKQIDFYLQNNPEKTIPDLQKDEEFKKIAVQVLGKNGYTALMDAQTGYFYFHPQTKLVNTDAHLLKDQLPDWWLIFEDTLGDCEESSGYYDWKEIDGAISKKFMYLVCVDTLTADGKKLFVGATTYTDEIIAENYLVQYEFTDASLQISDLELIEYNFRLWTKNMQEALAIASKIPSPSAFIRDIQEQSKQEDATTFAEQFTEKNGMLQTSENAGTFVATITTETEKLSPEEKKFLIAIQRNTKNYTLTIQNYFTAWGFVFASGHYAGYPYNSQLSRDYNALFKLDARYYLADPLHNPTKEAVFTHPFYDLDSKERRTNYLLPIYINETFLGVAIAELSLEKNLIEVSKKNFKGEGYAFIFDTNKHILVHPLYDTRIKEKMLTSEHFTAQDLHETELAQQINYIYDDANIVFYTENGQEYAFFYERLTNTPWYYGFVIKLAAKEEQTTTASHTQPFNLIFIISIFFILFFYFYLLLSSFNAKKNKLKFCYFSQIILGLLSVLFIIGMFLGLLSDYVLYFERAIFILLFWLFACFVPISFHLTGKKFNTLQYILFFALNTIFSLVLFFTQIFVQETSLHKETLQLVFTAGHAYFFFLIVNILYLLTGIIVLFLYFRKHLNKKEFLLFFHPFLFLIIAYTLYYVFHYASIYLLLIMPILLCLNVYMIINKQGNLVQKKNRVFMVLGALLVLIIALFLLSFFILTEQTKQNDLDAKIKLNYHLLEKYAYFLTENMDLLMNNLELLALQVAEENSTSEVVTTTLYNFQELTRGNTYATYRINSSGHIANMYPIDKNSLGVDISAQEHMQKIKLTKKSLMSNSFDAVEGFKAITLHAPVIESYIYRGTVAYLINLDRFSQVFLAGSEDYFDQLYLLDSTQTIIYSSSPTNSSTLNLESLSKNPDNLLITYEFMIEGQPWTFINIESKQALQETIQQKINNQYLFVLVIVIALIIIAFFSNFILTRTLRKEIEEKTVEISSNYALLQQQTHDLQHSNEEIMASKQSLLKAGDELKESEEKLNALFSAMTELVVLHELVCNEKGDAINYKIIDCNNAFTKSTHLTKQDVLGKLATEVYKQEFPPYLSIYAQVAQTEEPQHFETYYEPMKKYFSISVVAPKKNYFATITSDITERKKAEKSLQENEERFRILMNNIESVAVQGYDLDGTIHYWNAASEKMYGYSKEEAVNHSIFDLIIPLNMQDDIKKTMRVMIATDKPVPVEEMMLRRKDGSQIPILSNQTLVRLQGQKPEFFCMDLDITAQKKAEETLKNFNQELETKVTERTAEINRILKHKTEFVNQLNHDLRTPLTPLMTLLPLLAKKIDDEESKKMITVLLRNASNMNELIKQTLNLSRLDSGTIVFDFKKTEFSSYLRDILADNKVSTQSVEMLVNNKVQEKHDVLIDVLRMREVIENLLSNAKKYMGKGTLTIDAKTENNLLIVSFTDTGRGIAPEHIENMFKEFHKIESTGHDMQSFGLGLSIVKRIIEAHKGKIWVTSEGLGKGSIFFISIPLAPEEK